MNQYTDELLKDPSNTRVVVLITCRTAVQTDLAALTKPPNTVLVLIQNTGLRKKANINALPLFDLILNYYLGTISNTLLRLFWIRRFLSLIKQRRLVTLKLSCHFLLL